MDPQHIGSSVRDAWDRSIVPTLERYIRIPNQSPLFDPDWKAHGYMNQAVALAREWVDQQQISGLSSNVYEIDGRTPLLFLEVEGDPSSTVLMYGHLDKQPAMVGWEEGLGPWTPVLRDGRLYGRGGADDGYAVFSAVTGSSSAAKRAARPTSLPTSTCWPRRSARRVWSSASTAAAATMSSSG